MSQATTISPNGMAAVLLLSIEEAMVSPAFESKKEYVNLQFQSSLLSNGTFSFMHLPALLLFVLFMISQ